MQGGKLIKTYACNHTYMSKIKAWVFLLILINIKITYSYILGAPHAKKKVKLVYNMANPFLFRLSWVSIEIIFIIPKSLGDSP